MKVNFFLILLCASLILCNCSGTNTNNPENMLMVKIEASFSGTVGFGNIYKCKILSVLKGELDDDVIFLSILVDDEENEKLISSHLAPENLIMELIKYRKGESKKIIPVSGFVDQHMNSWAIKNMKVTTN